MSQSSVASVSPHGSPSLPLRKKKQDPPQPCSSSSSLSQKQLDIRMSGKSPGDSDSCLSVSPSPDPDSKATRFDFSRRDEGRPSMTAALQTEKDFMDFVLSLPQIQQDAIEKSHGISVARDDGDAPQGQEPSETQRQEPGWAIEEAVVTAEGAHGGGRSTLAVGKTPGAPRTEHKSPTRVPPPATTKIGLDHLDNLCKMMEQLGELREKNSRLQRRVQYLEDLRSLQEMHRDLQEQLVVRQVALGLIPSPLSGSETQLEDESEMLCRHGSEEMFQTFTCSSNKEIKESLQRPQAPLRRHSCLVDESGSSLPSASTLERSHAKGKKGHKSAWGKVKNMISTRRESVRKRPWQLKAEVGERDDPTEPTTSPAHSQATTTSDPEEYDMCDYESLLNELMDPMSPYPLSLDGTGPLCPGWDQGHGTTGSTMDGTGGVWMGPTPENEQNGGSAFSNTSRLPVPALSMASPTPPLTVRRSKPQLTITVPSSEDLIVLQSNQRGSASGGASTGDSGTSSSHSRHHRPLPQSLEAPQGSRLPTTPPSPRRSSNWTKVKQAFLTSQPQKQQQLQQPPHPHHRHTSSMQNPVTGADGVTDEGGGGAGGGGSDHSWSLPASPTKKSSFTLDGGAVGSVQKNIADLQKSLSGEFSRKLQEWEKLKSHGAGFGGLGGGGGGGGPLSPPPQSASSHQAEDNLPYEFRKKLQEWEKMKEKERIKGGDIGGRVQPPLQEDNKTKTHNEDDLPADFKKKLTEWEIRKALAGKSQHNVEELQKHLGEEFNRKMAEWERIKGQGGGGGGGGSGGGGASCSTCGGSTTTSAASGAPTCITCKNTTVTSPGPPSHGSSFVMPGILHHHQQQALAGGVKGSSGGSSSPRMDQKFSAPKGKKSKSVKHDKTPVGKNEVVTQQKHRDKELQWLEKELLKVEREKQRLEREREKFQERKARLEKMREAMRQGPAEKKDIYIKTSTGEFRFEGISQTFTKKLYEWEEQKGIRPESSTIALLGPKYSSPPANLVFENSSGPENESTVDKPRSPEVLRFLRSKSESSVADLVTSSPASLYSQPSCASLGRASADPEQLQADGKAASEPTLVTEEAVAEVPCALLVQLAEMHLDEEEKTAAAAAGVPTTTLSRTSTQRLVSSYAPAEITRLIDSSGRRRDEEDDEHQTTRLTIQQAASLEGRGGREGEGGKGGEDAAVEPPVTPRPRSRSAAPDFAQRDYHEPSPEGGDSSSPRKAESVYNEASYCSLLQENMTLLDKLRQKEDLCRALEDQMGDIDTKMEGVADMHQKTLEKLRRQVTILQDTGEALAAPDDADEEEEGREERPSRRRRRKLTRGGSGAEEDAEMKEEKEKESGAGEKDLEEDMQLDANRQLIEQLRARIVQLEMRGDQLMTEKEQLEATFALHKEQESEIAESLVQRIRELQDAGAEVSIQTGHCQAGQDSADDGCDAVQTKGVTHQQQQLSKDSALLQLKPPKVETTETTDTEDPDLETKSCGRAGRERETTEDDVEPHPKDTSVASEEEPPGAKEGTTEDKERESRNLQGGSRPTRPSRKRKKTPPKKVQKLHSLTSDLLFQAKRMEQVLVSRNSSAKGGLRGGPRSPSAYKAALGAWPLASSKTGLRGHSSLRLAGEVAPGVSSSSGLTAKGRRREAQRTWSSIEAICPDRPQEAKENSQISMSSWEGRLGGNSFSGRSVEAVASSPSGSPSQTASPLASWDTQELLAMNVELSRMAKQLRHEMMALWTFRESTSPESDSPESDHVRTSCASASFRTPGIFQHYDQEGDVAPDERGDLDRQQQQQKEQQQAAQLMAEAREVFQNIAALQMQGEELHAQESLEDTRGLSLHRGGSRRRPVPGGTPDGEATKRLRRDQRDGGIDDNDDDVTDHADDKDDYKEYHEAEADGNDDEGAVEGGSGDSDEEGGRSAGVRVRMKILNDAQNSRIVILNDDSKEMRRRRRRRRKEGGQLPRTSPPPPPTSSSPPTTLESPEVVLPYSSSPVATSQTTEDDSTVLSARSRSPSESPSLPSSVSESETTPMPESFFSFEDTDDMSLPGTWRTTTTTSTSATTRSGEHVLSSSFEWEDDEAYRLMSRPGESLRERSASDRPEVEGELVAAQVENDGASAFALKEYIRPEVPLVVIPASAASPAPKQLLVEGNRTWSEVAEEERRRFETEVTAQRLRVGYLRMRRVSDTQVEYAYDVDDPQDHRFAYTFSRTVFDDEALLAGRVRRGPSFRMMMPQDKMPTSWRRSRASPGSSKQEIGQDVFVPTKRTIFTVQANLTDPHETQATPTFVESQEEDVQGGSSSGQKLARREEKEKKKKKKKDGGQVSPEAKQRRLRRAERQMADDAGKKSSSHRRISAAASDVKCTTKDNTITAIPRRERDNEGKDAERELETRDEEKDVVTSLPLVKPHVAVLRTAPSLASSSPVQLSPRGSSSPQFSEPAPVASKGAKSRLLQAARDSSPTVKNMIRMYNQRITESQELLTRPFRSLSPESPTPSGAWRSPVSERKFVSSLSIREQRDKYEAEVSKVSKTGSTTTVSSQETGIHGDNEVTGIIHKSKSASVLPPPSSFAHYLEVQRSASSNLVSKSMNERATAAAVRNVEPPASAPPIFEGGQPQLLSKSSTSGSCDLFGVDSAPETSPAVSPNPLDVDTSYELDASTDKPASPLQSKQQSPEAKTPSAKVRAMRIKKAKEEFLARGLAVLGSEDQRSRISQDRVVLRSRAGTTSTEESSRDSCEVDLLAVELPSATPSPQPEGHLSSGSSQSHPPKSKETSNERGVPEAPFQRRDSKRRSRTPQPRESFRRQSAGCLVEKQQETPSSPVLKSASSGILMAKRKASKSHSSQRKGSGETESGRAVRGLFKIFRRSKEKDRKDMPAIQSLCRQSLVVDIPERKGSSVSGRKSKRREAETPRKDQGGAQVAGDNRSSATLPRGCAASDAPAATTSRSCPSSPVAPHRSKAANLLARGRDIFKSRSPSPHKRPR